MLMSRRAAPLPASMAAASPIGSGSAPAIWWTRSCSEGSWIRNSDGLVRCATTPSAESISVK